MFTRENHDSPSPHFNKRTAACAPGKYLISGEISLIEASLATLCPHRREIRAKERSRSAHNASRRQLKMNQTPRRPSRIVAILLVDKKSRVILSSVCEVNDLPCF
ncbi:hypothetical protein ACS0PU_006771 [Formica fusca]